LSAKTNPLRKNEKTQEELCRFLKKNLIRDKSFLQEETAIKREGKTGQKKNKQKLPPHTNREGGPMEAREIKAI